MKYVLSILFSSVSILLIAQQNILFTPNNFISKENELATAILAIEEGDYFLKLGDEHINEALSEYLKAYKFNPNNAALNFKIGKCYLLSKTEKLTALNYFKKSKTLNSNLDNKLDLFIGKAYQIRLEPDSAIAFYELYLNKIGKDNHDELEKTQRKIRECNFAKVQIANPKRVAIKNLGIKINSKYADYDPIISSDNELLLFTSRRTSTTGENSDGKRIENFEDIWQSQKENGVWTKAKKLGKPINTKLHDAVVGLSPDGQRLLIYRDGDIYQSFLDGLDWSKPKKLLKTINSSAHESSASLSFNDEQLFFISERSGGKGKKDIWVSTWDNEQWVWKEPENLGGIVNTELNEETVFAHPDGKTLYFSSEGHLGMGGYDIFKTVLQEDGTWGVPQNIGYPINSSGEDVSFVLAANGKHGYYSSANEKSIGQRDIFEITFLPSAKKKTSTSKIDSSKEESQTLSSQASIYKGTIKNEKTAKSIASVIEIYDNENGKLILKTNSNAVTGKFLMALPVNKNYNITIKAEGYLFHSENFYIDANESFKEIIKDINLKPLSIGASIILNNIFFDYNSSTLSDVSKVELLNVLELMKSNLNIKVEISGHTDNIGTDVYNQKLSEDRAKSVVDYLIKNEIQKSSLSYVGKGETQSIADNITKEGQQLNRRTEVTIIAF